MGIAVRWKSFFKKVTALQTGDLLSHFNTVCWNSLRQTASILLSHTRVLSIERRKPHGQYMSMQGLKNAI